MRWNSSIRVLTLCLLGLLGLMAISSRTIPAFAGSTAPPSITHYHITDLGTLGGNGSEALALNNNGQVVGMSYTSGGTYHAFLWQSETGMTDVNPLGSAFSAAYGINDNGQIVGFANFIAGAKPGLHAFCWPNPSGNANLGTLTGGNESYAFGINSTGQVVGQSKIYDGSTHAFLWQNGVGMTDLGTLGGTNSVAAGINNSGQVAGYSHTSSNAYHAFRWQSGAGMIDLGTLGGSASQACGINNSGQVAGYASTNSNANHAFCWQSGIGMTDLGTFSGSSSYAVGINDSCQIVGKVNTSDGDHAALWQGGAIIDLNTKLDQPSGWKLDAPYAINNSGWIVGSGAHNSQRCAFLLKPQYSTTLTVDDKTAERDTTIDLTATLQSDNPQGKANKTIAFYMNGVLIDSRPTLDNGKATLSYHIPNSLAGGANTITASFAGEEGYDKSSGTGTLWVIIPDSIPPTTTISLLGTAGQHGWYTSNVVVTLSAVDNPGGNGVKNTEYSYDGITWLPYAGPFILSTEGSLTLSYRSTDLNNNVETAQTQLIKIDKTAPILTGAPTITPNANGWYHTDVPVHFYAVDATSGMDVSPSDGTITTEGTGQSISATATDQAGNTATCTVGSINIDKTAPTIVGAATTQPNGNGWYKTDVTVHFTASDAGSGLVADPADVTITAEGTGKSATATATDKAGNATSCTVGDINIDKTAPTISGAATTQPNANGWYNSDVTVHFTASDSLSGIQTDPADVTISSDGSGKSATATATDKAGNSASSTVGGINIDKTAPVLTGAPTTAPNANGWYNTNVTVHFTVSDTASGVLAPPADVTITEEGTGKSATASVTDQAGNTTSCTVSGINIDKTAPTISGAPTTAPNGNGWYKTDVTVKFTGADTLSGVDTTTPDTTISTEGAAQSVSGTVTDKAGNTATCAVGDINIDKTAPTISGAATTQPNANGWYKTDVTVHFTTSDAGSGLVADPADVTITAEGTGKSAAATATDKAGNATTCTVGDINIDKTAPSISGAATTQPNSNGWYNTDVTVHFTASDAGSGLDGSPADVTITTEGTGKSATATATDKAGNTTSCTVSGINIDKTAPTISGAPTTAPNSNGWYKTDVTVKFTGADTLSGVDTITPDTTISTEGAAQSVSGTVTDKAGNTATCAVGDINIDKTAPTITGAATTQPNANGWYKTDVTVHFTASDAGSGLVEDPADVTITEEGTGKSAAATATDKAGNASTCTVGDINIDKTAPTISGAATTQPNGNGWYKTDVTVHFTAADAGSGLVAVPADVTITEEGTGKSATATATDKAGNTTSCLVNGINIDKTAPSISGAATTKPNANGWYTAAVTVHFTAADSGSGVDTITPGADVTINTNGTDQSATGTAIDKAGNSASATVGGINISTVAPTVISLNGATHLSIPNTGRLTITDLKGTGFHPGATVCLTNGGHSITAMNVQVVSDTKITCDFNFNSNDPVEWALVVTNVDGLSGKLDPAVKLNTAPPTLVHIIPASASTNTLVSVTDLAGYGIQPGATVTIAYHGNTIALTGVQYFGTTMVTGQLDLKDAEAGAWDVVLTNPDGQRATLPGAFVIGPTPTPTLSSVSPATAPNTGTKTLTLTGSNYTTSPLPTVTLSAVGKSTITATNVQVVGNTLTCQVNLKDVPCGLRDVTITNYGGQFATLPNSFAITPVDLTGVTLSVNMNWPQPAGTTLTLSAQKIGTATPVEYAFWASVYNETTRQWEERKLRDYSTGSTFAWKATEPANYFIYVKARKVGSSDDYQVVSAKVEFHIQVGTLTGVSLAVLPSASPKAGDTVTLTATKLGTAPDVEYQFIGYKYNAKTGTYDYFVIRGYNQDNSCTWQPTSGAYRLYVLARIVGSTASFQQASPAYSYIVK